MGGGLMQLVAYGAQDIYLTGNPQITFWKVVYRRHTNFARESIQQTMNGTAGYGNRVTTTVSRNGDLLDGVHLEYVASGVDQTECANPGTALIDNIECQIGGQMIDKHYGHWMETWSELTESNPSGAQPLHAAVAVHTTEATGWTRFQRATGSGGVKGAAATMGRIYLPFQFWFCRNPGLALPLIALQYHEVKLVISFNTQAANGGAATFGTASLWCDYVYLDTDERRRFAQVSHEYLIEQVQFQSFSSAATHDLTLNHPVKELIWTGGVTAAAAGAQVGPSTPLALLDTTYQLKLNGHERFAARNLRYFSRHLVNKHHSGYGSVNVVDGIACYPFALEPEEHQPSGTCNFSRIDTAQLVLGSADAVNVYAVNYNVLRIMSGMGGLAYSN
jgi:hypothetical protein